MAGESSAVSNGVEGTLEADEEIRWQETSRHYSYLPHVVGVTVVIVGGIVTALVLMPFGFAGPIPLIGGGVLVWCPVGYLLYRELGGPGGPYVYVATDRRILVISESEHGETRSIPWKDVDSILMTTDRNGSRDGIAIETGEEARSPQVWGPLSSGVLLNLPTGTVENTFRELLALRRQHDPFDPASVDPARVGWSTSRDDVSDALAAELDPGESVKWYARPDERGFHAIWVLAAVFVAVHVYAGCIFLATSVLSLPSTPSQVGSLLIAGGSVGALRLAQVRLSDIEYVVTNERFIRKAGLRGDVETVRWSAVTDIERTGNSITVATPGNSEALRFRRIPDLDIACRYIQHLRDR